MKYGSVWMLAFVTIVCESTPAQTQSLPNGWLTADANGASAWPVNQSTDHKWQWHYDSSQFQAPGPITIIEIYVRASSATATVSAFNFPSFVVTLASSPTDYSVAGSGGVPGHSSTFSNNLNPDAMVVRTGPWIGGPVPPIPGSPAAPWIPMGLTSSFAYDPTTGNDFVLQIEKCGGGMIWNTSIDGPSGGAGTIFGNRYGVNNSCTATSSTLQNNEFVPVIRIDYLPMSTLPEYQVNQTAATLDINGIQGTPMAPATVNLGIGQTGLVTIASLATGSAWDIGYGAAALVPRSAGGLSTSDGQVLNLDLSDPTFGLLWSGFQSPPFTNLVLSLTVPAPTMLSFQMAVIVPTSPAGVALSQPLRLSVP